MKFYVEVREDGWPDYPNYDGIRHVLHLLNVGDIVVHCWGQIVNCIEANANASVVTSIKQTWPKAVNDGK